MPHEVEMSVQSARQTWSGEYGRRRYPARADYEGHPALGGGVELLTPTALVAVQKHWHASGQNGCPFAQWIAKRTGSPTWTHLVARGVDAPDAELLRHSVGNPACQLVSVLYPDITELGTAIEVIENLPRLVTEFTVEIANVVVGYDLFELRYRLSSELTAWVMGFGPFAEMAATRRSPLFELVWRVKPKPSWLFEKLNHDQSIAHLADFPAPIKRSAWTRMFTFTQAETRRLLGKEPDRITAAKTTLAVPAASGNLC